MFSGNPERTRFMTNTRSQFGRIIGRDGYIALGDTVEDNIIGIHDYKAADNTVTLVLILRIDANNSQLAFWNGSSLTEGEYDFVTTAEDSSDAFVDFIQHNNKLHFITPNAADINTWNGDNTGAALSTPPGRYIASFGGYLLIGASTGGLSDGTLQTVRYDDADNGSTWPAGNVLNLRETGGAIKRMLPLGKQLWCYTTTGATILRFVGSSLTIFSQERAPIAVGLLASGSLVDIPGVGHILLASDGRLHVNDGSLMQPVLTDLNNTLQRDLNLTHAGKCYGSLDPQNNIYTLAYPGTGSTDLNKRLDFNYLTGEFSIFEYSGFDRIYYSQYNSGSLAIPSFDLVGSSGVQAYKLDSGLTDNGTVIPYEWQSDWIWMGEPGQKTLQKIDLIFDPTPEAEVDVGVAVDLSPDFKQVKSFSLASARNNRDVIVRYNAAPTMLGQYFNIRVRYRPKVQGSDCVLKGMLVYYMSHEQSEIPEVQQNIRGRV